MPVRYYPFVTILCLTLLIGLIRLKHLHSNYRWLLLLVFFNLICDTIARWMSYKVGTNYPIFHFQLPIHVILYWIIYKKTFQLNKYWNAGFILCLIFILLNSALQNSFWIFPSYGVMALALTILSVTLYGFLNLTKSKELIPIHNRPDFWFLLGNLMFFSITFFSFGLINFIHANFPEWLIWSIYGGNLVMYSSYFVSISVEKKQHNYEK